MEPALLHRKGNLQLQIYGPPTYPVLGQYPKITNSDRLNKTCVFRTPRLKSPDYQGILIFQVSLHANGYFRTITKCPDYGGVPIFKCAD